MRYQTAASARRQRVDALPFDILERVLVDQDGVEVGDLDGAVTEARHAIAELRLEAERNAGRGAASQAEFRSDLLLRVDPERVICMIPLDDRPVGQGIDRPVRHARRDRFRPARFGSPAIVRRLVDASSRVTERL